MISPMSFVKNEFVKSTSQVPGSSGLEILRNSLHVDIQIKPLEDDIRACCQQLNMSRDEVMNWLHAQTSLISPQLILDEWIALAGLPECFQQSHGKEQHPAQQCESPEHLEAQQNMMQDDVDLGKREDPDYEFEEDGSTDSDTLARAETPSKRGRDSPKSSSRIRKKFKPECDQMKHSPKKRKTSQTSQQSSTKRAQTRFTDGQRSILQSACRTGVLEDSGNDEKLALFVGLTVKQVKQYRQHRKAQAKKLGCQASDLFPEPQDLMTPKGRGGVVRFTTSQKNVLRIGWEQKVLSDSIEIVSKLTGLSVKQVKQYIQHQKQKEKK